MYIVDKYQTAQYKDSLHKMGPTVYLVPEKMTHWQYDENIKDYVKGTGTVGRNTCGGLIHDVRAKFKNYLISLPGAQVPTDDPTHPLVLDRFPLAQRILRGFGEP